MSESVLPTSPFRFFASKSIAVHLLRGAVAAALIAIAIKMSEENPGMSVATGIGALVMLRGCPMCWTIGLLETIRTRFRTRVREDAN